jgi:alpha-mannosidase
MKKTTKLMCLFASMAMSVSAQQTESKPFTAYMVSDAHLDTQWNWDIQTTIRTYVWNTLNQNLFLLKKYPEYVFNFEGGVKYAWMKEYYPTQYEQLKEYIGNGRWHLAGSGWDATEAIVSSPESWIRNILLGQTFYRQEFGKEGNDVFLPDCFGFPYTMPTLAAHCGLIGFSSQKLQWRHAPFYDGGKKYPFTVGLWKGIDGSSIMMAHGFDYGKKWKDGEDLSRSEELIREAKESPLNIVYRYYGTGDIGGSPDMKSVQAVTSSVRGDGPVKVISATSSQLYEDFLPFDKHPELPMFDGELTMDLHGNGCYTSQAAMKLYNRQNELLGDATERAAVMADWAGAYTYPGKDLTEDWRRIIVHQFHDDVTGTSIPRAYTFSWNDELLSSKRFVSTMNNSVGGISDALNTKVSGEPIVVYNSESFPMKAIATIDLTDNKSDYKVYDEQGKRVVSQLIKNNKGQSQLLFEANLPSVGMAVYNVKKGGKANSNAVAKSNVLENSVYRLTVDQQGNISSIIDKRANKELVASGKALRLVVFDDCKSTAWPAWEIQKHTLDKAPVAVDDGVKVSMVENGALRKTILIEKRYGDSDIRQYIHLYEGSLADRIDFNTQVEWHSLNALLKAELPLNVNNENATYGLGLGSIARGNNKPTAFEVYAQDWADLTDRDGSYGVTIFNGSKYGWDKPADNVLRLSLLYSPQTANSYAYQDRQDWGHHEFTYSIVGHKNGLDHAQTAEKAATFNSKPKTFKVEKHNGELGKSFSFVQCDNPNVIIRALKQAETDDAYVVRVYELSGKQSQKAHLTFAANILAAEEADGTEKAIGQANFAGKQLDVDIKPFSVKTYKVRLQKKQPMRTIAREFLNLDFDRKCFSYNEMRFSANFEGGYSYAAELIPEEGITVDGIPFSFGNLDSYSGMSCKGNVIELPKNHNYQHVYLLAASDQGDRSATFTIGKSKQEVNVPYYSGFIGQWGHTGQNVGYLKDGRVAYVGTHRHSSTQDEPYEFTYMFMLRLDVPKGATQITVPNDEHIVIFAATATDNANMSQPAMAFYRTNNISDKLEENSGNEFGENVMKNAKVLACSGQVNEKESAEMLIDGKDDTKWCDTSAAPNWVTFDLGSEQTVSGWKLLNAASETSSYVTRGCLLQGRNSTTEEWQTIDMLDGNRSNVVERRFEPATYRYIRLYVTAPAQEINSNVTRIYNFELYK